MEDIKIGNKIPRCVCVLKQHYGVQKNHQLLRTPETLKIIRDVYSNGIIFVILILVIINTLRVMHSGCCLLCALGSLYSRETAVY